MAVFNAKTEEKRSELTNRCGIMFQQANGRHRVAINIAQTAGMFLFHLTLSTRPDPFGFYIFMSLQIS